MTHTDSNAISAPLSATLFIRYIYSFALLAFFPALLVGSSGWIALVLGGGMSSGVGPTVALLFCALAIFRCYQVLRYPAALDARPPNILGKLFRFTGVAAMFVGAVAGASLFLVKPITLALFKSAGDGGVAYFVVGIWLVLLANFGWLGCLSFELSRISGPKFSPETVSKARPKRRQDFAVLGVLVAVAIALPFLLSQVVEKPCGEANLALCVSTAEGGVQRVVGLPNGEPVILESSVEEIEYRQNSSGRPWSLIESPSASLEAAGHPLANSPSANVRVTLDASSVSDGVVLTLTVHDGAEETSRFITRFGKSATIEKTPNGGIRVVVNLPANAKPGMRSMHEDKTNHKQYSLDQVFIQIRSAIGSEIEAREWPLRIVRPATHDTTAAAAHQHYENEQFSSACKEKVVGGPSQSIAFEGEIGWPLWGATFKESGTTGPHTLLSNRDRVVCHDGEVWIVSYPIRRPELRMRRYSSDGHLLRFVDTTIPPAKLDKLEYEFVDPESVREEGGQIHFERVVMKLSNNGKEHEIKRELFVVTL